MKKILLKISAIYLVIASIAISSQISQIVAVNAALVDYPIVQCVILNNDLIFGSTDQNSGNQVTLLQTFLTQKGYELNNDTFGIFGYGTKDAVAIFQAKHGLIPTGFVGNNTREAIKNLSCSNNVWANFPATREISNIPNNNCGINTGWIWNGSTCVNTCDQFHPWNKNTQKCSAANDYYSNYSNPVVQVQDLCDRGFHWTGHSCTSDMVEITSQLANANICTVYGNKFVWNGLYCVEPQNYNYCGTDNQIFWNGSSCVKTFVTEYLCQTNGKYYKNPKFCPASVSANQYDYVNVYTNNMSNRHSQNTKIIISNIIIVDDYEDNDDGCEDICYVNFYKTNSVNINDRVINTGYYDIYGNYHKS